MSRAWGAVLRPSIESRQRAGIVRHARPPIYNRLDRPRTEIVSEEESCPVDRAAITPRGRAARVPEHLGFLIVARRFRTHAATRRWLTTEGPLGPRRSAASHARNEARATSIDHTLGGLPADHDARARLGDPDGPVAHTRAEAPRNTQPAPAGTGAARPGDPDSPTRRRVHEAPINPWPTVASVARPVDPNRPASAPRRGRRDAMLHSARHAPLLPCSTQRPGDPDDLRGPNSHLARATRGGGGGATRYRTAVASAYQACSSGDA